MATTATAARPARPQRYRYQGPGRVGAGAAGGAIGTKLAPHLAQKRASAGFSWPQPWQVTDGAGPASDASVAPQLPQKTASEGFSWPHAGHTWDAAGRAAPQVAQNTASAGFTVPQELHFKVFGPSFVPGGSGQPGQGATSAVLPAMSRTFSSSHPATATVASHRLAMKPLILSL